MKNLKKEIEELSDKEVKTILKSTVVCGVSLLVVGILTKKYLINMKTIKEYAENNKRLTDLVIENNIALDDLSKDVTLLKKVVAKNE